MVYNQLLSLILINQEIWIPNIISMTSGLIGALIGGGVAWIINKQNHKEERSRIAEMDKKEEKKIIQNIYGKIYSLNTTIIHYLQLEFYHVVNYDLFCHLYKIEKDSIKKAKYYEIQKNEYEKQIEARSRVIETTKEYSEYIGQYKYINSESKIMQLYYEFYERYKNIYSIPEFDQNTNQQEAEKKRDLVYIELCKSLETEIKQTLKKILEEVSL